MAKRAFKFRGIDVRSNQLDRAGNTARDCSNVRLDSINALVKREEFTAEGITKSALGDTSFWDDELPDDSTIIDFVEFNGKFILMVKTPPLTLLTTDFAVSLYEYDVDTSTLTVIPNNIGQTAVQQAELGWANYASTAFDGKVTHFEKNGCLYFISSSNSETGLGQGTPLLMKYDGDVWHAAGVNPITSPTSNVADIGTRTPPDYYIRILPMHIDSQGNQIFGQWTVEYQTASPNIIDFRGRTAKLDEYNTATLYSTAVQNLTQGAGLTITAYTNDCMVGQYVFWLVKSTDTLYRFKILSKTGSTVTFDHPTIYTDGVWATAPGSFTIPLVAFDVFSATILLCYYSTSYTAGYVFGDYGISTRIGSGSYVIDFNPAAPNVVPSWGVFTTNFEDFYGDEIKGNPPAGLQVREYGDVCLLLDSNFLYYSDLSLNGTVENFTAFDFISIGEEEKGDNVSFFSNETFIAVFKERGAYIVLGNIFTGNFRVQSYRTTGIGGTSPASVIEVDAQCLFASNKGPNIALENGSFAEVGDRIEPIFSDDIYSIALSFTSADSALDYKRELIYMAFSSGNGASEDIVLLYDYRNREWFKYNSVSARGGMLVKISDNKLYYSDGNDIYAEASSYTSGVSAYWRSNYETLGDASLKKRFQRFTLFLTSLLSGAIGFKSYKNWIDATAYTDETINPTATIPLDSRSLNPSLDYSTSFEITSTGTAVLNTDGFEYVYEQEQEGVNDESRQ